MEVQDYLKILVRRWRLVAVVAIVVTAGSVAASLAITPLYKSTVQLFVSVQGAVSTSDLLQGADFTRQRVTSYTRFVTSPKVLSPVVEELHLSETPDELAMAVAADSPIDTTLINITVADPDPSEASVTANAIGREFRSFVTNLETPDAGGAASVKISVVRDATPPTGPSSPNRKLNIALGALVGAALGIASALMRELLDTRVRTVDDVSRITAAPVVGSIGQDKDASKQPLFVQMAPRSARSEDIRRLRTNIQFLGVADRPRSIVVTSTLPGEGKTTTVTNLAVALADAGARVALVDADLHRPDVARYMGLEGSVGLTTVLIGQSLLKDAMQEWGNGRLQVLPSGRVPPNPSELLGSLAMAHVMSQLVATFDVVLVDTPPLLPVTDAAIVSKLAGGAVVVVGVGEVKRGQLEAALSGLRTLDARVLGLVLNRQRRSGPTPYGYYGDSPRRTKSERTRRRQDAQVRPAVAPSATDQIAEGASHAGVRHARAAVSQAERFADREQSDREGSAT